MLPSSTGVLLALPPLVIQPSWVLPSNRSIQPSCFSCSVNSLSAARAGEPRRAKPASSAAIFVMGGYSLAVGQELRSAGRQGTVLSRSRPRRRIAQGRVYQSQSGLTAWGKQRGRPPVTALGVEVDGPSRPLLAGAGFGLGVAFLVGAYSVDCVEEVGRRRPQRHPAGLIVGQQVLAVLDQALKVRPREVVGG